MDEIKKIRKKIDKIDAQISKLLQKRHFFIKNLAKIKKIKNIPTKDEKREREILDNLDTNYEKKIFKCILKESRKNQREVIGREI